MINAAQIRMGRASLRWRAIDLAEKAGVGLATINRIEGGAGSNSSTLAAIQRALEDGGVIFGELDGRPAVVAPVRDDARKGDLGMIAPITITDCSQLGSVKDDARNQKSDELLGFVEVVRFLLDRSLMPLPIRAEFPDPPDILISSANSIIAVEVRRITWSRMSQVMSSAVPGDIVEMNPELCVDGPARRGIESTQGKRSGDYHAIKKRGEKLDGRGWLGNEPEEKMLGALEKAVIDKNKKFDSYKKNTDNVWLFLFDNSFPASWRDILSNETMKKKMGEICSSSRFQRILLFDDQTVFDIHYRA